MSLIRIIVTDKDTVVTGEIHGSLGDPLIASLTADPETIEELETAIQRFVEKDSSFPIGEWFRKTPLEDPLEFLYAMELEPYDAGILIVDLAGRIIVNESTYTAYSREDEIDIVDRFSDENKEQKFALPYRLSSDWEFINDALLYEGSAVERRKERLGVTPLDTRAILFGEPMLRFVAEELSKSKIPESDELQAHLHSLWLMKEREDLEGKSPRQVLLENRDFIDFDLHSRSLQYSFSKNCPPDLSSETNAYKFSGYGLHENVVYYDLMRHLFDVYCKRLTSEGTLPIEGGIAFLAVEKDKWMQSPFEEFSGRIPGEIIDSERRRRNLTMSAHECIIDENCPICIEMSQIFDTPMFWHLDGSHMDNKFAFSFHETYEEWQAEELAFESYMKREIQREGLDDMDDEMFKVKSGSAF